MNYKFFKINFSNTVKKSFDFLPRDIYYPNLRYRRYSLIDLNENKIIGNEVFNQDINYNKYLGNKIRKYDNINKYLLNDYTFLNLLTLFKKNINLGNNDLKNNDLKNNDLKNINLENINMENNENNNLIENINKIYVHQIRVSANNQNINPVPEGIHKDGFNFICIACVNRFNIDGPYNEILDLNKNIVNKKILNENRALFLNDNKYYHNVTKFKKVNKYLKGYRDIFVLTTFN